ncbi:U3 small nucleolar ribonucleoprotein imp3 [Tieghemiomyces parasiticus]|uniref:U3 small nucleolar ribonucleoprotein protein IMP3 n=1 Tax=Tieghemiomyces parasiticus TaxID=78921 RepID=A0A9W8AB90_9FUNG|nr:U3 small nucleolar ribonucleoprotein imp3 [Tieghemiomyces parasiticus]KAJ1927117.1 U3 small nucleolar ribonucleoprotein imp3 [Tieghemiomyces parasiticus]
MVRQFKYHESKLLKKVDFLEYKNEKNIEQIRVIGRYNLKNREEYLQYGQLAYEARRLTKMLAKLDAKDTYRLEQENRLLDKLYDMGIIDTRNQMSKAATVTVEHFCRRRLAVVMCRNRMSESIPRATKLILQGHVRIGTEIVTDPAFLVTRGNEDFLTWVDSSKVKRHVLKYNDQLDDYDLL